MRRLDDLAHLRQVWLVRTETFPWQTTPRADTAPVEVEDHDNLPNLRWQRLAGGSRLGVVRSHWGIEHNGVRTLEMDWQEEPPWCTKGTAADVLGL